MFFMKKDKKALPEETNTTVSPGKVFRWPKGAKITAIDPVVIALPKALFQMGEKIGDVVEADDEMNTAIPPDSENILLFVQPGMSVTIKKHSESYVVANDQAPRRVRITEPSTTESK
jgi:hypothetical protein